MEFLSECLGQPSTETQEQNRHTHLVPLLSEHRQLLLLLTPQMQKLQQSEQSEASERSLRVLKLSRAAAGYAPSKHLAVV